MIAARRRPWFVISNGCFLTQSDGHLLSQILHDPAADVVAVTVSPALAAYRERVRLTREGQLVGYRRLYQDSVEHLPAPADWPHHLFVRGTIIDAALDGGLPNEFHCFADRCRARGFTLKSVAVAGTVVDLALPEGIVSLCREALSRAPQHDAVSPTAGRLVAGSSASGGGISPRSRFVGPVLVGDHVSVDADAIVVGPSVLCDHSTIHGRAVVDTCVVGSHAVVERDQIVRNSVVAAGGPAGRPFAATGTHRAMEGVAGRRTNAAFRSWPKRSYAGWLKRAADIVTATGVLILFAPIIPFIALAIKISSPGPVFFKHKRQGLYGRPFECIKFRTMRPGADELQDKLRFVSEVDGPQFKMADDPRITTVGRFLRETYLDEIPQFYNVLKAR